MTPGQSYIIVIRIRKKVAIMVGEVTRDHCDLDALKLEKCGRIFDIVKRGVHRRRNEGGKRGRAVAAEPGWPVKRKVRRSCE